MAIGISYEGDGFIRNLPAVGGNAARTSAEAAGNPTAGVGEGAVGLADIASVEARARAMRREYLSEWLCRLLDRWA